MSIASEIARVQQGVDSAYGALVRKGVNVGKRNTDLLPSYIASVGADANDGYVRFYDPFLGRYVYNWDFATLQSAEALPEPIAYEGFTFGGWGYTLEELQNLGWPCDCGAVYYRNEGTVIDFHADGGFLGSRIDIHVSGVQDIVVDWGDYTYDEFGDTHQHMYHEEGDYRMIIFSPENLIGTDRTYSLLGFNVQRVQIKRVYVDKYLFTPLMITNKCKATLEEIPYNSGNQVQFSDCVMLTKAPVLAKRVNNSITFRGCTRLKIMSNIPQWVNNLQNAFRGCGDLETMPYLPKVMTANGLDYAFYESGVRALTPIPDTVRSLTYAFYKSQITWIKDGDLPDTITSARYAFSECQALFRVDCMPSGMLNGERMFGTSQSVALWRFELPEGMTNMTNMYYNTSVANIKIPSTMVNMTQAFGWCWNMKRIPLLPNGVTNINSLCYGCQQLTEPPEVPPSVTNMGGAFGYTAFRRFYLRYYLPLNRCFELRTTRPLEIHCTTAEPITLTYAEPFFNSANVIRDFKIFVPRSADHSILNAYKTATGWCEYADKIYEEDEDFVAPPSPYIN